MLFLFFLKTCISLFEKCAEGLFGPKGRFYGVEKNFHSRLDPELSFYQVSEKSLEPFSSAPDSPHLSGFLISAPSSHLRAGVKSYKKFLFFSFPSVISKNEISFYSSLRSSGRPSAQWKRNFSMIVVVFWCWLLRACIVVGEFKVMMVMVVGFGDKGQGQVCGWWRHRHNSDVISMKELRIEVKGFVKVM